ncbi:MAG: fasciclin domain-containing protein [Gemmatimonadota bacterium]|jgi:uncharacterized surface protein with fasciclin (FAS1) repeats
MTRSILAIAGLVGAVGLGACSEPASSPLTPDLAMSTAEARSVQAPLAKGTESIAEMAIAGGFGELVEALTYVDTELNTGLVDLFLNGTDQFTVFAPTDQAFANLYGLLSAVLETDIDDVTDLPAPVVLDVLLYHVAEGRRAANSVVPRKNDRIITSLLGETFSVRADRSIQDGLTGLREDATITTPNLSARNGIIHVIDEVIVPPSVVAALTS